MKTKAKVLTTISVLLVVIVTIVVLCSTVFCVGSINVVWHTETRNLTEKETLVVASSGINNGNSVFLVGKDEAIEKIETQFPYIKVLSIETVFPNVLNIHAVEREPVFAVQLTENSYVITDEDFKVLDVKTGNFNSTSSNEIKIFGTFSSTQITSTSSGNYLQMPELEQFKSIKENFALRNMDLSQLKGFIKSATFQDDKIILNTFYGVEIYIYEPQERQQEKVAMLLEVFQSLNAERRASGIIGVYENPENRIVGSHHPKNV